MFKYFSTLILNKTKQDDQEPEGNQGENTVELPIYYEQFRNNYYLT